VIELIVSLQVFSSDNFSMVQPLPEGHGLAESDRSFPKMLQDVSEFGRAH
jgi:hypothetical protein